MYNKHVHSTMTRSLSYRCHEQTDDGRVVCIKLYIKNFLHGSAMRSLSLVMTECSLSGRAHGHVSNFYIVDLENFATASRQ